MRYGQAVSSPGKKRSFMMIARTALAGLAISILAGALAPAPTLAQNARDAELVGFHQLCDKGDRKACIRFGILIGQNQERHAEWRRLHPEWWWWER